jgi:hypothetical protein
VAFAIVAGATTEPKQAAKRAPTKPSNAARRRSTPARRA